MFSQERSHYNNILTQPLTGLEELAILRFQQVEGFPQVYPYEPEAVRDFVQDIGSMLGQKIEKGTKAFRYLEVLLRVAEAYRKGGVVELQKHIYENLGIMIAALTSGKIDDFDAYEFCEHGDTALALLNRYGGSLELVEESLPELKREMFYPTGVDSTNLEQGAILFICGYGATAEPYKGIFEHFNIPVITYQLPHGVIGEKPETVEQTFTQVKNKILEDPLLGKVTHIIGNSIGTMFASRLSIDICKKRPEAKIQTALVQVGTSWQDALERTQAKFSDQLKARLTKSGKEFKDFNKVLRQYNPRDLAGDLAELIKEGQLDLSLFIGLGDKMIYPVHDLVSQFTEKLDSEGAKNKYNAYMSEVAGHNSAMLFFLWLMSQKATSWARIFKTFNQQTDSIQEAKAEKYHTKKKVETHEDEEMLVGA